MKIIDTHTHLNVEPLLSSIDEVISRAKEVGVEKVINNADSIESFSVLEDLSLRYKDFCYQAIGLFPLERKDFEKDMNALRNALRNNHNVVALGEVGLDYHYEKDEESKKSLNVMISESERLSNLVHEFLELSKLESGNIKLNKEKVDINTLIKDEIEKLDVDIKNKRLNIKLDLCKDGNLIVDKEKTEKNNKEGKSLKSLLPKIDKVLGGDE